ncbi:hypothetical protein MSI_11000 [Treponema sp. JC4]|uniref:hypothetical protein n=1 Tax=Treponema sp. JC4 TaxID=1124982 RepID=UPI00025B0DE3|nr:hypothetical protein [Treponema sp. JC4]EID85382.1 hypothetical protein MSI_11000 [Treponema sp. JC4]
MDTKELKEMMMKQGVPEEQIEKVDLAKLAEIIDKASNIDEIGAGLKELFPDFDEAAFRKKIAENTEASDKVEDLSDNALASVAGGAGKNKMSTEDKVLAIVGGIIAVGALGYLAVEGTKPR